MAARIMNDSRFPEEKPVRALSAGDARRFLKLLARPPKPNAAARRAAQRFKKRYP
jgi:uncharacterized protein (DUF1778 family)